MPKTRRDRSVSYERCRKSPRLSSSSDAKKMTPSHSENMEDVKEWEEARCPICMEHPHNAVLLICSSYKKGCRPYMCDTSYRHSNCLDKFCKSSTVSADSFSVSAAAPEMLGPVDSYNGFDSEATVSNSVERMNQEPSVNLNFIGMHELQNKLLCPLCRGQISGWMVVETARQFMNAKSRSCSCESCDFSGNYADLRKHARHEHPLVRPSEADPRRQRHWRRMERQRDIGDVLSIIQSSLGDDSNDDYILPMDDSGGWLTVFFLIRVFRSSTSSRSRRSGSSRAMARVGVRRRLSRLWGESYDIDAGSGHRDDEHESSDSGSPTLWRRVRRRATPDDQS